MGRSLNSAHRVSLELELGALVALAIVSLDTKLLSMRNGARTRPKTSELTQHVGFWMRRVSNHASSSFARKLACCDVTVAEWVVLREMYSHDDTTSPGAVAEFAGLTRSAVSKLINRLLEKGLVTRRESASDRRYQDIELTNAAVELVPRMARLAD